MTVMVPFDEWRETNAGDRMEWAQEMLAVLAEDYRDMALEDRIHVRKVLREAAGWQEE
jgi:hypothetical protein